MERHESNPGGVNRDIALVTYLSIWPSNVGRYVLEYHHDQTECYQANGAKDRHS